MQPLLEATKISKEYHIGLAEPLVVLKDIDISIFDGIIDGKMGIIVGQIKIFI